MKHHPMFMPVKQLMLRSPLLPVSAFTADQQTCLEMVKQPLLAVALMVGSEDLAAQLSRSHTDDRRRDRAGSAVQRYVIRMSTRPTPFGMFAGVGVVELGESTRVQLGDGGPRTRMRPDMRWLLTAVANMEAQPQLRHQLSATAHSAIEIVADRVVLSEQAHSAHPDRLGAVSIRATPVVLAALEMAQQPTPWDSLAERLAHTSQAPLVRVHRLLDQLWEQGFLVTQLQPPLTHPQPARYVVDTLAAVPAAATSRSSLLAVLDTMAGWDALPVADRQNATNQVIEQAAQVLPGGPQPVAQIDTALTLCEPTVNAAIGQAAAEAAELLVRLADPTIAAPLTSYRRAFTARYGGDREVGLLELLDPLRGLGPPPPELATTTPTHSRQQRDGVLRGLATEALRDRRTTVILTQADLDALTTMVPAQSAPMSVDLTVFVLAHSAAHIDAGDFQLLLGPNLGAQAAGRTLGRFASLLGEPASQALHKIADTEQSHDREANHAELVYLPADSRAANVAVRPSMWESEIALGTNASVPPDRTVTLQDLVVGVEDDHLYVRSLSDGRIVHAHTGHMLNGSRATAAVRLLEDIGRSGRQQLRPFSWGPAAGMPFLPRIQVGRVILAPAQWRIDSRMIRRDLRPDDVGFGDRLLSWRQSWMVPALIYLARGDQRLLLDLDRSDHQHQLATALRQPTTQPILLHEGLPGPEHSWLTGPTGERHLCELVIPLIQPPPTAPQTPLEHTHPRQRTARPGVRHAGPGSNWLYVKIYGPADRQDALLAGPLGDLAQAMILGGLADDWFFIRYADPDSHLRLRFHGSPKTLLHEVLPELTLLAGEVAAAGDSSTLVIDGYEREFERYGGPASMAVVERIFSVDSATALTLIGLRIGEESPDLVTARVLSVDALLDGLGLDPDRRRSWYNTWTPNTRLSGTEYRTKKDQLRRLLRPGTGEQPYDPQLQGIFNTQARQLGHLGRQLEEMAATGAMTRDIDAVLASLVHMHLNRHACPGAPSDALVLGLLARTTEGLARSS